MHKNSDFYRTLFQGAADGLVSIFIKDAGQIPKIVFADVHSIDQEVERVVKAHPGTTIFYGMGLLSDRPASGRGTNEDVTSVYGFYLDIDVPGANDSQYANASATPVTTEEILAALSEINLKPAAITKTGNGFHAYFLLDGPFLIEGDADRERVIEAFRGANRYAKEKLAAKGWRIDPTAEPARLDRAVGSFNVKNPAQPKPVTMEFLDPEQRYSMSALEGFAALATQLGRPSRPVVWSADDVANRDGDFDAVLAGCAFMRHCVEHPDMLSEPEWRAMIGTLAYCKNGRALAHRYSAGHLTYDTSETDRMFDRMSVEAGPPTYPHIRSILSSYEPDESFALYGTVVAPISFARMKPDVARLVARYAYVVGEDRFVTLDTFEPRHTKAFDAEHLHLKGLGTPSKDFLRSSRAIKPQRRDYLPGKPRLVTEDDGSLSLNSYRATGVVPKKGDWPTIQRHFDTVFPDAQDRNAVLDRIAMAVQQPGQKIKSAVMMFGPEGGGKGTIIEMLTTLVGRENVVTLPSSAIDDAFQDDRVNKQIVIFNEVSGIRKAAVNSLKELITEPMIMVQGKMIARYSGRTPSQVWVTTNDDAALQLNDGDRRWLVFRTPDVPPTTAYFDELYAALPSELPGFAEAMATRSLAHFNPNARPPVTAAKAQMIRNASSDLEYAIREAMDAEVGVFSKDFGSAAEVIRALAQTWTGRPLHTKGVGAILTSMGTAKMERVTIPDGTKQYYHAWRNKDHWIRADRAAVWAHRGFTTTSAQIVQLHPAVNALVQSAENSSKQAAG